MIGMGLQTEGEGSREQAPLRRAMLDLYSVAKIFFLIVPAFSGIFISIGGFNLSPERIAAFLFVGPLIYLILKGARYERANGIVYCKTARWAYFLWTVSLAISTLQNDPRGHLTGYILLVIPVLYFFLFSTYSPRVAVVDRWAFVVLAYLGLGALVDFLAHVGSGAHVASTVLEPNIFGSTVAIYILINLHRFRRTPVSLLTFFIAVFGLIVSFSRGPYVGFLIGIAVYAFLYVRVIDRRYYKRFVMVCLLLAIFCLLLSPVLWSFYNLNLNRGGTIYARGVVITFAIQHFLAHPIWGNGALDGGYSSIYLMGILGTNVAAGGAIWQMMVAIAHDSGIIGLTLYVAFLISLLVHGYHAVIATRDPRRLSYLSAAVAGLIASQATTIHYMAVSGVVLGLVGASYLPGLSRHDCPVEPDEGEECHQDYDDS